METRVCKKCGRELPLDKFELVKYSNGANYRRRTCKDCVYKEQKQRAARKQEEGVGLFASTPSPTLSLAGFDDHTLFAELRKRGYSGELRYSKVVNV